MNPNIIVLSTALLHALMEDIFSILLPEGGYRIVDYTEIKEVPDLYAALEQETDGFILVGGRVVKAAIQKALRRPLKPVASFMVNSTSFYKLLLDLLIKNRALDLHRVVMDAVVVLRGYSSLADLQAEGNEAKFDSGMQAWMDQLNLEEIYTLEETITRMIAARWKAKKMDLAICIYSGVQERLQQKGIPCVLAYPDVETVKVALDRLLADIQLAAMRENLPVVISVGLANQGGDSEQESVALHKCLLDFSREHITGFLVQKTFDGFDIFTSLRVANQLTGQFSSCPLGRYLAARLERAVCVGYGVGADIAQAKTNAANARKEASAGASYVIDEKNLLIGPLDSDQYLAITSEVTPEMNRAAEKAGLSTLTIQKIDSVMKLLGTQELTTLDLAAKLGVSVRNAQRILGALEKSGLAVVQSHKSSKSMGRPVKVYEINLS